MNEMCHTEHSLVVITGYWVRRSCWEGRKGVEIAKIQAIKMIILCQLEIETIKRKRDKEHFTGSLY